ncbi:hypothetical protein B0H16DRAFT_1475837 [Mycena metata]|uniref:Sc15 protein n=1 Tax=Mycena metata TaxID=1033252 RepID=A0AAD7HDQ9_9AGAR|nr:hypothetical protein B0H16DRAFT_1475837 [Mycena metata]
MFALRAVSLFFLAATLATASPVAAPAAVDKRASTAAVQSVLTTLQSNTNTILPQLNALSTSGTASEANVTPLIGQLTSAINTATSSLSSLPASNKRQTEDEVATVVAGIITEIGTTLNVLPIEAIPGLETLIVAVDVALEELLVGLDVVIAGVITLVSGLLVTVSVLLDSVGLGLVLGLLGLGL